MRFSRRAARLAESATARVFRLATERRAAGRDVIDLSAGQPDFPSPTCAVEAARRALAEGHTRYTPVAGLADLRAALAARYARDSSAPWRSENFVVTVGAKAALFQAMQILVDEGDEVVIPTPAWVSFEEQARLAGGEVVRVPLDAEDAFQIRAAPIVDAMTSRTRLVLVNSPSNPTGGTVSAEDLRILAIACADRGAVLLADETYERFLYDGAEHASVAALARDFPQTVLLVGSFSKTWSMTGWRLGWAAGARELVAKLVAVQSHTTSNPTTFAMYGALAALEEAEDDVERMLEAFTRRRAVALEALGEIPGVRCAAPSGAFYAFPDVSATYRPGREGSLALAEHLLEHEGVAVVPGVAFGDDRHLRLSFACDEATLLEGIARIRRVLAE